MSKKISYTEAFEELQAIVAEIETGAITVDVLSEKVKRATELIGICQDKLTTTEEDVNTVLKELEKKESFNHLTVAVGRTEPTGAEEEDE